MKKAGNNKSTKERFVYYSSEPDINGCINWLGQKDKNGYGRIKQTKDKRIRAHRYAYETFIGEIPEGYLVCHKCDNPSCVNHKHLFLGTPSDNTRDMHIKGRAAFNMKDLPMKMLPNSKLSKENVLEIRKLIKSGLTQKNIAKLFDVHFSTIQKINSKTTWYHI